MAMILVLWNIPLTAAAGEGNKTAMAEDGRFMTAVETVEAKAEPKRDAETIFSFVKGDIIFIIGETEEGWYVVSYQGETGYIEKTASRSKLEEKELDVEALNAELEAQEAESKLVVEETERYRAESRRSKVWGAVIVLLILGILATGIISTVRMEKSGRKNVKKNKDVE